MWCKQYSSPSRTGQIFACLLSTERDRFAVNHGTNSSAIRRLFFQQRRISLMVSVNGFITVSSGSESIQLSPLPTPQTRTKYIRLSAGCVLQWLDRLMRHHQSSRNRFRFVLGGMNLRPLYGAGCAKFFRSGFTSVTSPSKLSQYRPSELRQSTFHLELLRHYGCTGRRQKSKMVGSPVFMFQNCRRAPSLPPLTGVFHPQNTQQTSPHQSGRIVSSLHLRCLPKAIGPYAIQIFLHV